MTAPSSFLEFYRFPSSDKASEPCKGGKRKVLRDEWIVGFVIFNGFVGNMKNTVSSSV